MPRIEINPTPTFLVFAEMQMAMHEYATDLKDGVAPEWLRKISMGVECTSHGMPALFFATEVPRDDQYRTMRAVTIRHLVESRQVELGFVQDTPTQSPMAAAQARLPKQIRETRVIDWTGDELQELGSALAEDIYHFFFTAEVPEILTY